MKFIYINQTNNKSSALKFEEQNKSNLRRFLGIDRPAEMYEKGSQKAYKMERRRNECWRMEKDFLCARINFPNFEIAFRCFPFYDFKAPCLLSS